VFVHDVERDLLEQLEGLIAKRGLYGFGGYQPALRLVSTDPPLKRAEPDVEFFCLGDQAIPFR
jgi:hypothetical protein